MLNSWSAFIVVGKSVAFYLCLVQEKLPLLVELCAQGGGGDRVQSQTSIGECIIRGDMIEKWVYLDWRILGQHNLIFENMWIDLLCREEQSTLLGFWWG